MYKFLSLFLLIGCCFPSVGLAKEQWTAPDEKELPESILFKKFISRARFVYCPKENGEYPLTGYFRLTIDVQESVESARCLAFFEKRGDMFINGKKLTGKPISSDQYRGHIKGSWYDFTGELKPGKNVIAFTTGRNNTVKGCFGCIMRGTIRFKSGKESLIVTDASVKASSTATNGWNTADFDDSKWGPAYELGDVSFGPWITYGNVPELYCSPEELKEYDAAFRLPSALEKKLVAEPDMKVKIAYHGDIPAIQVNNDTFLPPFMGNFNGLSPFLRDDAMLKEYKAGLRVFRVGIADDGNSIRATGEYDFNEFSRSMNRFLQLAPEGYMMLMISPDILWDRWCKAHPEDMIGYCNPNVKGKDRWTGNYNAPSCASRAYREEQARFIEALAKVCRENSWGKHVVGLGMWYGPSGDGYPWGFYQGMPDCSKPMTEAFRRYVKDKYKTVDALRKAWGEDDVTFETVQVPNVKERNARGHFLHDLQYPPERKLTDYYRCYNDQFAEMYLEMAKIWKKALPNRLFGMYYGYILLPYDPVGVTADFEKILARPEIDIMFGTTLHYNRTSGQIRHLPSPFHRLGKLSMNEGDIRTIIAWRDKTGEPQWSCKTEEETVATLRKLYGNAIFNGTGYHLVSFNSIHPYWFNHPLVLTELHRSTELWKQMWNKPLESTADVAVIFSPIEKVLHGHPTQPENYGLDTAREYDCLEAINFSGAAYDFLSLTDFLNSEKHYKTVIFVNQYTVSDAEREMILKRLQQNKGTVVWQMAPGYVSEQGFSDAAMEKLTGLPLVAELKKGPLQIRLDDNRMMAVKIYGQLIYDSPRTFVRWKEGITVWGRYPDTAEVALAYKRLPNGSYSFFSGIPIIYSDLFRRIFKQSGVHLYTSMPGLYVRSGSSMLMIFAEKAGKHEITLPKMAKTVRDFTTGEVIASNTKSFTLENEKHMTWLLKIE